MWNNSQLRVVSWKGNHCSNIQNQSSIETKLLHGEAYIWASQENISCKFLKTVQVRNKDYFMLNPCTLPTMAADNSFKKLVNLTHNLRILRFSANCYCFQHALYSFESNSQNLTLTQIRHSQLSGHGHLLSILFIKKLR